MSFLLDSDFFYLSQIPSLLTAADLRRIFSQFIEADAFVYFHYRRRPDSTKFNKHVSVDLTLFLRYIKRKRNPKSTNFAVPIAVKPEFTETFTRIFDELWQTDNTAYNTKLIKIENKTKESLELNKCLSELLEFRPPSWMPQGNVGTKSSHFFNLIRECQLSPDIIKKLQLSFPRSCSNRKYGSVSFNYESNFDASIQPSIDDEVETELYKHRNEKSRPGLTFSAPISTDELPEEWDRFQSLHDDPYNVDRSANKNLKYESKIELKWEKGGSGLVHYMDEFAWRQHDNVRRDEFFDEPASFDWDIDTEHYEDARDGGGGGLLTRMSAPGDLDTVQLIDLQGVSRSQPIPSCGRAFSSDYAKRVMTKYGWKPGSKLGKGQRVVNSSDSRGLLHPISIEGSLPPRIYTGVGFRAPKRMASSNRLVPFPPPLVYIRSVFDTPDLVAYRTGESCLLPHNRPDPEDEIKYRADWMPKKRTIILTPHATRGVEGICFQSAGMLISKDNQK